MKTYIFIKKIFGYDYGFTINNLHNGKGFSIHFANFFVWHQAWFGTQNQVSWYDGKCKIIFPSLRILYSTKNGWFKW